MRKFACLAAVSRGGVSRRGPDGRGPGADNNRCYCELLLHPRQTRHAKLHGL